MMESEGEKAMGFLAYANKLESGSYKECMKNHAASIGGHALDGCCEFMPQPTSFFCGACGCHRNFHTNTPSSPHILKKRFRTKFSKDQKDKMYHFAQRLGWKMHKTDAAAVHEFCNQIGVAKEVLNVWMHNNNNTTLRRTTNNNALLSPNASSSSA